MVSGSQTQEENGRMNTQRKWESMDGTRGEGVNNVNHNTEIEEESTETQRRSREDE